MVSVRKQAKLNVELSFNGVRIMTGSTVRQAINFPLRAAYPRESYLEYYQKA